MKCLALSLAVITSLGISLTLLSPETAQGEGAAPAPASATDDPRMALIQRMNQLRIETGDVKPMLSQNDYQKILAGKMAFQGREVAGTEFKEGTGGLILKVPAWKLWRAVVDEFHHEEFMPGISYSDVVRGSGEGRFIYQMFAAPVPFVAVRHWIVSAHHQSELWKKSEGVVWQARFKAIPEMKGAVDKAIGDQKLPARPANEDLTGAVLVVKSTASWTLVELGQNETLAEYRAFSDPGGSVPSSALNTFAPETAEQLLKAVAKQGAKDGHYGANHPGLTDPLYRPMIPGSAPRP